MTLDTKALEAAAAAVNDAIDTHGEFALGSIATAAIEAYLSQATTPSRNDILEEAAKVVAGFIRYGGRTEHGITINPYADATEILRAIRALEKTP